MDPAISQRSRNDQPHTKKTKNRKRIGSLVSYLAAHILPQLYHAVSSALPTWQIRPGNSCFVVHVSGE